MLRRAAAPPGAEWIAAPSLTSLETPNFGDPVSQPATRDQITHPAYVERLRQLSLAPGTDDDLAWSLAYILQTLDRYGALHPGARGLGLGGGIADELHGALACYDHVAAPEERLTTDLHDVDDFDFVWALQPGCDRTAVRDLALRSMTRLRPGGLLAHVFSFDPTDENLTDALRRNDIERLALDAISLGHEVAQLKFRDHRRTRWHAGIVPFGLLMRRANQSRP